MDKLPNEINCEVCAKQFPKGSIVSATLVRPPVAELIRKDHPNWSDTSSICLSDLNRYRSDYVEQSLKNERGELSELEHQVVESLRQHETLAENVNDQFDQKATLGERIADRQSPPSENGM